jgi:hypothetical protein
LGVDVVVGGSAVVVVTADLGAIFGSVVAGTAKADVNTIMKSNGIIVLRAIMILIARDLAAKFLRLTISILYKRLV